MHFLTKEKYFFAKFLPFFRFSQIQLPGGKIWEWYRIFQIFWHLCWTWVCFNIEMGHLKAKNPCVMNAPDSPSFLLVDWTLVATHVYCIELYLASVYRIEREYHIGQAWKTTTFFLIKTSETAYFLFLYSSRASFLVINLP